MTFNLNLYVTGLCACVPAAGQSVVIVLPNAYDYDTSGQPLPIGSPDRHTPMLCLPALPPGQIATARQNWLYIPPAQNLAKDALIAFPLDEEDIGVSPVSAAATPLPAPVVGPCLSPAEPKTHFGWTCNMADANPGQPLLPEVTANAFPAGLASARLWVMNGTWSTDQLASGSGLIVRWYYADMMNKNISVVTRRAIADVVKVTITISAGQQVVFQSNKGNITLTTGGNDVEAWLVNIPLSTLGASTGGPAQAEMHFLHFHRLCTTPGTLLPWPDVTDCGPLATTLIPHCPPARF